MIDSLLASKAARNEKRSERRAQRLEHMNEGLHEEAVAAGKISASMENTYEHIKEKLAR